MYNIVVLFYANLIIGFYNKYMKPKEKGDIAEAQAITYFMMNRYEVCLPVGNKRPYDMVVELEGVLSKVQVKYAGLYTTQAKYKAALRTMGGNQSYYSAKKYNDNDFDLLFVYVENGRKFIFPWNDITNRNSLSVESSKYLQYEVK